MTSMEIFVSHNHADGEYCDILVEALSKAGADVWYDKSSMGPAKLTDTIERELRRRLVFVVVLSPDALRSNWVRDESTWAYSLYKRDPERSRIILPVVARQVHEDDIWLFLSDFKRIAAEDCAPLPQHQAVQQLLSLLVLASANDPRDTTAMRIFTSQELVERGIALLSQRRYNEAFSFFDVLTTLLPQDSAVWGYKARTLNYLRRFEEALAASEEALRYDENNAVGWNYRGLALSYLKQDANEILACYEHALAVNPSYAYALGNKGYTLSMERQHAEALVCYDMALDLDPGYAYAWVGKGTTLHALARDEEALPCYEKALELDPNFGRAWYSKAISLQALKREPEAEVVFQRAMELGFTPPPSE